MVCESIVQSPSFPPIGVTTSVRETPASLDLPGLSGLERVAERIQDNLRQPFQLDGYELFTSASIGIATSETGYGN